MDEFKKKLGNKDFKRLSKFIHQTLGIKMPNSKQLMVESRLSKRVRLLKLKSFTDYCDFLFSKEGMENELEELINAITTNKTDFFREPEHFNHLVNTTLPQLITKNGTGIRKKLIIWSCGCSTGMEAYTIAMILTEFSSRHPGLNFDFMILATDVSPKVLSIGQKAIYNIEAAEPIPDSFKKKYLLKSKNRSKSLIKIIPELRKRVKFRELNLLDNNYHFRENIDIVFFRNVMIYFNEETKTYILKRIYLNTRDNGILYIGHSENLSNINPGFKQIAPTIYKKQ